MADTLKYRKEKWVSRNMPPSLVRSFVLSWILDTRTCALMFRPSPYPPAFTPYTLADPTQAGGGSRFAISRRAVGRCFGCGVAGGPMGTFEGLAAW